MTSLNKVIWICWFQGWDKAPDIAHTCVQSWRYHNPDWKINLIDNNNIEQYVPLDAILPGLNTNNISKSDILRITLLKYHGGIWADATCFCNKPLDEWLPEGPFMFGEPMKGRMVANWFIKTEANTYIINKWYESMVSWWKYRIAETDQYAHLYGWSFELFHRCYNTDKEFSQIWDSVPKISCKHDTGGRGIGPHYFCPYDKYFYEPLTDEVKSAIDSKDVPAYKLTYKTNTDWRSPETRNVHPTDQKIRINFLENGQLHYLLKTIEE